MTLLLLLLGCIPEGSQGPEGTDYIPDTDWDSGEPTGCIPDSDPAISQDELVFDSTIVSRFRGEQEPISAESWDFSGGSVSVEVQLRSLSEFWFADDFSGATHVAALDLHEESWGVYRAEADQLWLLGVASATPGWTALSYSPAVTIWETPIQTGDSWSSQATATGLYEGESFPLDLGLGNEVMLVHDYTVEADSAGEVMVDAGHFDAQRISIGLEATGTDIYGWQWGQVATQTWLYIAPCTGLVARVTDLSYMGLGL